MQGKNVTKLCKIVLALFIKTSSISTLNLCRSSKISADYKKHLELNPSQIDALLLPHLFLHLVKSKYVLVSTPPRCLCLCPEMSKFAFYLLINMQIEICALFCPFNKCNCMEVKAGLS